MKEIKFKTFLMNIILFSFINNIFVQSYICKKYRYCDQCDIFFDLKIIVDENRCGAKYLYCLNNNDQLIAYNDSLKSYYINYLYSNSDIRNACETKY